ncbi:MAG TPA: hypothetical protein PKY31_04105 [Spirochaetota bacterium]|nr:hypothetical protein [Spirochaetota bacterium]
MKTIQELREELDELDTLIKRTGCLATLNLKISTVMLEKSRASMVDNGPAYRAAVEKLKPLKARYQELLALHKKRLAIVDLLHRQQDPKHPHFRGEYVPEARP